MDHVKHGQAAAIVCGEIANAKVSILYAKRTDPDEPADSGWQFLCGASAEDWQSAQVWALQEVIEYDRSLLPYMDCPVGTVLTRRTSADSWHVKNVLTDEQ